MPFAGLIEVPWKRLKWNTFLPTYLFILSSVVVRKSLAEQDVRVSLITLFFFLSSFLFPAVVLVCLLIFFSYIHTGYYATYIEIWLPYWSCEFEPRPLADVIFSCAKTAGKNIVAAKQKVAYWVSLIKIFIGSMPCAMPVNSTVTAVQNSIENPV